ncbi:MAG: TlpA disulfide reductase family protein [Bacteroidota bacterium]
MKLGLKIGRLSIQLLFITCLTFSGYGQTVIRGEILNYDGKKLVSYNPTVEGIHTTYWESVKPSENGHFKITLDNERLGTVRIHFNSVEYRLLYGENSEIKLTIDQAKLGKPKYKYDYGEKKLFINDSIRKAGLVEISGTFKEVNRYYNSVMRTAFSAFPVDGTTHSRLITEAKTLTVANKKLDSLISAEINSLNSLHIVESENSSNEYAQLPIQRIKEFMRNEIKAYYACVYINGLNNRRVKQMRVLKKDPNVEMTIYNSEWEKLSEDFLANINRKVNPTTNSIDFNTLLFKLDFFKDQYNIYEFESDRRSTDEMIYDALIHPDTTFFNSKQTKLSSRIQALKIYMENQFFYSPTLLDCYYQLEKMYPGSIHLKFFEPQVNNLRSYIKTNSKDFNEAQLIKTNFTRFTDLLKEFDGRYVFIDVWATWCHPCIKEFPFMKKLDSFWSKNEIDLLYISVDRPEWKKRWQQSIKYNALKGYHVRANNELKLDMWKYLDGYQGAIPRYALVNKSGELILPTASKPSEPELLVEQIIKTINLDKKVEGE